MSQEPKQRILLLDIETSPNVGYSWGKYEQTIIEFIEPWYLLSYAYKWLGKPTQVKALCDYPKYKPSHNNDLNLVKDLWKLLDEAEIVVAQNGDAFDFKKINTRFIHHRMEPPSPFKTIDTLKIARDRFGFNSNKLDDLGKDLNEGEKLKHLGFPLWKGCMSGDKKCWATMKRYNKRDVDLLEKIYLRFRPFARGHPNMGVYHDKYVCPRCQSTHLIHSGMYTNRTGKFYRLKCTDCGGWSITKTPVERREILRSI